MDYTTDGQKVTKRNVDNYEGISLLKTMQEVMVSFIENPEFSFYKPLVIENINSEILAFHIRRRFCRLAL